LALSTRKIAQPEDGEISNRSIERVSNLRHRIRHLLQGPYADLVLLKDRDRGFRGANILELADRISEIVKEESAPWERVAIHLTPSPEQIICILGVMLAERVPVILGDQPGIHKTEAQCRLGIRSAYNSGPILSASAVLLTPSFDLTLVHARSMKQVLTLDERSAFVLMSSGSTGDPKGICIPLQGVECTVNELIKRFNLGRHTVAPLLLPTCHSMALNTQLLPTLLAGGVSVFMEGAKRTNSSYRMVVRECGTFVAIVADLVRLLWDEHRRFGVPVAEHVEHVQLAGGYIHHSHIAMARDLFPNARIHKGYGLTEAIRVTMTEVDLQGEITDSVGQPLSFVEVEIRDESGTCLEAGRTGEIFVRGPAVMVGRMENPSLVYTDSQGYLATGDVGYLREDGQLVVKGRLDGVYKLSGLKVAGAEIERAVVENILDVKTAKCLAVFDERVTRQRLVLYLEVENATSANLDVLESEIASVIALTSHRFEHFPRDIVLLEKLPRGENGKVLLHDLEKDWRARMASSSSANGDEVFCGRSTNLRIYQAVQ
jgi:acyl-CoA synthetase (AMP-forming)/AMP-acid ligase II